MMNDDCQLIEQIRLNLEKANVSVVDKPRMLVALSGGADSVCLLRGLLMLGCECVAAHCNFHLRGEESMRDERFVRRLCEQMGVELHVQDFDVTGYKHQRRGMSTEMACRELRYNWFEQIRHQLNCCKIAVAHHADDSVETFFINLLRGTGINGLTGIAACRGEVVRPLITVTRVQILQFLDRVGQDFVTDSTNLENDFRRNRLRNIVLPEVERQFPGALRQIMNTMNHLRDEQSLLYYLVRNLAGDLECHDKDNSITRLKLEPLRMSPDPGMMLYALVRQHGFTRSQCDQAMSATVGSQFHASSKTLIVEREFIDIQSNSNINEEELGVDFEHVEHLPVKLEVRFGGPPFSPLMVDGRCSVAFGKEILQCGRVVLRHWRKGDRFHPFGMRGTKLVSDLFADHKLTNTDKKTVWLLEADGEIVWVLGLRAAQVYKVQPGTQNYVLVTLVE